MWNVRLNESQAGIKITRRTINSLRYADIWYADIISQIWGWKRKVKKAGLKLNIQKMEIMISDSISYGWIDGEEV